MNSYCDLKTFKSYFQITDTTYDVDLLQKLVDGSRDVEKDMARFFYSYLGTRYFATGRFQAKKRITIDDLQSYTEVAIDIDGSGNFITLDLAKTIPDAFLLDQQQETNKTPYIYLEANPNGAYPVWGEAVRRGVKITGVWGYGNDWPAPAYDSLGDTVQDNPMTAGQLTMLVSSASLVSPGQTLRADLEQMYVSAFDTGTKIATVKRAMNGTTAAAHLQNTVLYIYRYPEPITHAVQIYAAREWRRRQSAYSNRIENPILGTVEVFKDKDPSYMSVVKAYRRPRFGRVM